VKRKVLILVAFGLCASGAIGADDNISQAQDRLAAEGFFQGTRSGVYDSETAAAVTRFQIRNGLAISGKLDAPTAKALGVSAATTEAEPKVLSGTWKRLRNGELQFIPKPTPSGSVQRPAASATASATESRDNLAPRPLNAASPTTTALPAADAQTDPDRLRDYVAAFVLAGLDPHVGSELEFFASHVDYFGSPNVSHDRIERDLLRYDRRWPERRFWLDGNIQVQEQSDQAVKVVFPLHYELRNGPRRASGKVLKSLTLMKLSGNQLQIIAVNERKI
jgi:hypothetical protein